MIKSKIISDGAYERAKRKVDIELGTCPLCGEEYAIYEDGLFSKKYLCCFCHAEWKYKNKDIKAAIRQEIENKKSDTTRNN